MLPFLRNAHLREGEEGCSISPVGKWTSEEEIRQMHAQGLDPDQEASQESRGLWWNRYSLLPRSSLLIPDD